MLAPDDATIRARIQTFCSLTEVHACRTGSHWRKNMLNYLLAIDQEPEYIVPMAKGAEAAAEFRRSWAEPWLRPRLQKAGVLD